MIKIEEALDAILASNMRTYLFISFDLQFMNGSKHTATYEHLDKGQQVVSYMLVRTNEYMRDIIDSVGLGETFDS